MIIQKDSPVGLEKIIDRFQQKLFTKLCNTWEMEPTEYTCYPKVYRNQSASGQYIAEWYNGKGYVEAYFDDTKKAVSFFGISRESLVSQPENVSNTFIHLVFFVDLNKVKPIPDGFRNDEAARIDVHRIVDTVGAAMGIQVVKFGTGIDYCLSEYPGTRKDVGMKFRDQHPIHCFRFDLSIFYQPSQILCNS